MKNNVSACLQPQDKKVPIFPGAEGLDASSWTYVLMATNTAKTSAVLYIWIYNI